MENIQPKSFSKISPLFDVTIPYLENPTLNIECYLPILSVTVNITLNAFRHIISGNPLDIEPLY